MMLKAMRQNCSSTASIDSPNCRIMSSACSQAAMKRGRAEAILQEVRSAVARWREFAEQAGVPEAWRGQIQENLRLEPPA